MVAAASRKRYSHTGPNMIDLVHTGPGTLAGRYMRLFWQPLYHSDDISPGDAKPIRIMSQDLTLFRGESGTPHLVDFRCAHRGTQLSTGWVEEDSIRCFYHGWRYDGSGQCVEQPAEERPFCEKVHIGGYPCRDYLGLVFAYRGEGEPPPFPRYPDMEDFEGFTEMDSYSRGCNFWNQLDNDPAHAAFVHRGEPGSFGFTDHPIHTEEWESKWGMTVKVTRPSGRGAIIQWGMPNVIHSKVHPVVPELLDYREFLVWIVPVDDESYTYWVVNAVRLPPDKVEQYKKIREARLAKRTVPKEQYLEPILAGHLRRADVDRETTDMLRLQDDVSMIAQGRIADRERETLAGTDACIILKRKIWTRELQALAEGRPLKQWVYDPEDVVSERDKR